MLGTAGLPHILMRFYTVPDARTARTSVGYATAFIGFFYLLTFILGFGAMVLVGRDAITAIDAGGNMAAPLLAEAVGGTPFLGFIAAVAFATILAVVAGLTLSGAATLSHDLWVNVVRGGNADRARAAPRGARRDGRCWRSSSIVLGIAFKGQNVAYMVGLAFAIAASANFPALVLSIFWSRLTTAGAQASMLVGTVVDAGADLSVADDPDRHPAQHARRGSRCGIRASSRSRCRSPSRSACRCCGRFRLRRVASRSSSGSCIWESSRRPFRIVTRIASRDRRRSSRAARGSGRILRAEKSRAVAACAGLGHLRADDARVLLTASPRSKSVCSTMPGSSSRTRPRSCRRSQRRGPTSG